MVVAVVESTVTFGWPGTASVVGSIIIIGSDKIIDVVELMIIIITYNYIYSLVFSYIPQSNT